MSKKIVNAIAITLVLCVLLCGTAYADNRESKYFNTYAGWCSWNGSSVKVYFDTSANETVDQLGSTQIKLYESTDLTSWTLVKTFYYSSYPNMMAYNAYTMDSNVSYNNAVYGRYYKATITFAVINGSDREYRTYYTSYI
jgi:hypothetical protein